MTALNSATITHGEFVKLTTSTTTYTFCNAAAPITVGGNTFTSLGSLLSVGAVNREIKATSIDMVIGLIGIDPTNISLVLGSNIKGSTVEIWRGFFDSNYQIQHVDHGRLERQHPKPYRYRVDLLHIVQIYSRKQNRRHQNQSFNMAATLRI
jgi:hypothetical protein